MCAFNRFDTVAIEMDSGSTEKMLADQTRSIKLADYLVLICF